MLSFFIHSQQVDLITLQLYVLFSALTIGGLPDDGEEDLVLRRVQVEDAERRVGDDDSGVFLHVDAAD